MIINTVTLTCDFCEAPFAVAGATVPIVRRLARTAGWVRNRLTPGGPIHDFCPECHAARKRTLAKRRHRS